MSSHLELLTLVLFDCTDGMCREKSKSASKMKPWQGYSHAAVVAISVWFCRETIFDALQWWNGRPPSDGLLLGFCIVLIGLACIPIVALHFSHVLVCLFTVFLFRLLYLPSDYLDKEPSSLC